MAALARGDRQAMAWLIQRYGPGLRRFLAGVLTDANEAEDVAQDTFLRVWRAAARYDPGRASPATWIYRIGLRQAIEAAILEQAAAALSSGN